MAKPNWVARRWLWSILMGVALTIGWGGDADARRTAKRRRRTKTIKPWYKDTTRAQRRQALHLFKQATKLHVRDKYADALEKYKEALEQWKHPSIQFNMARCLVKMGRKIAAFKLLKQALRYGADPFRKAIYRRALEFQSMLDGQLAKVTVRCSTPGARVTLNGKLLFTGPGEETRLVEPGKHEVVASKKKYITMTRTLTVFAGKTAEATLRLMKIKTLVSKTIVMKRRWKRWLPWTVMGIGAVVAAVGLPLILQAQSEYGQFDSYIKANCSGSGTTPLGCSVTTVPDSIYDHETNGDSMKYASIALFAAGGAAVAAGVVMVILNRARPTELDASPKSDKGKVTFMPSVWPGGAAFNAGFTF